MDGLSSLMTEPINIVTLCSVSFEIAVETSFNQVQFKQYIAAFFLKTSKINYLKLIE